MKKLWTIIVVIILIAVSTFNISAVYQIESSNQFICYDAKTSETIYPDTDNRTADTNLYSPSYEGNIEKIEAVYSEINAKNDTQNIVSPFIETNSIIGNDGRFKVGAEICKPYSRICYLEITWPNGAHAFGTGWLYARDRVATAGHNVFNTEHGFWADSILVQPGRYDDYAPFGEDVSFLFGSNTAWTVDHDPDYDFGLIQLNEPLGDVCGYFGYAANSGMIGTRVTISGYPGDKNPWDSPNRYQWAMRGGLTRVTSHKLHYFIDTEHGQSGSPIYKNDLTVIGVHTYDGILNNSGTRIYTDMFHFMQHF